MITMEEIAVQAGLSRYTVSKILNGDPTVKKVNRDKVLALCDKYGFVPDSSAVALVSGHSNIIAMVVPYITDGFYSELIEITEKYASSKGMRLTYQSSYNDPEVEAKLLRSFMGMKAAAMLAVPVVDPDLRIHALAAARFPVIYLDRTIPGEVSSVVNDNRSSAEIMTDHLFERASTVAYLGSFYGESNRVARDRCCGYQEAVKKHHSKALFIPLNNSAVKQDNEIFGYENFSAYLKNNPPPEALFCVTDAVALGAMRALRDAGFVPGVDTIVGGHDNLHFTEYTTPTLSSMAQPKIEIAHTAVDMALARIADKTLPCEQKVFASVLKRRQSSTI